jgi:hypothetical protein
MAIEDLSLRCASRFNGVNIKVLWFQYFGFNTLVSILWFQYSGFNTLVLILNRPSYADPAFYFARAITYRLFFPC